MSRSVRQANSFTISGASDTVLTTTYGEPPASSAVYTCLGNEVTVSGSTDTFVQIDAGSTYINSDGSTTDIDDDGLYCDDGSGVQLIALDVTDLQFYEISDASGTISDDGLEVMIEVDGIPPSYGDADADDIGEFSFILALRQKVLSGL